MKGVILAGGSGTRLYPVTQQISKHLLPVYDKPMIYYPLSAMMLGGIREILVVTTPEDLGSYQRLLGEGAHFGISIVYAIQRRPEGIAQALLVGADFIGASPICLTLGDNLIYGHGLRDLMLRCASLQEGAIGLAYTVKNPSDYGVVEINAEGEVVSLEEKPRIPRSTYALTGFYFYDGRAVDHARSLKPSGRGELEITDLNNVYLDRGQLRVEMLGRGYAWLDMGTPNSLLSASNFIQTIEERQGLKVACLEEIAWRNGWIDESQLKVQVDALAGSTYGTYLMQLFRDLPQRFV
jgi:glucose-1-phosphate thymidylyltransferase